MNNNMSLEITDYLSYDGENYLINSPDDLELLMAFGQKAEYSFLLTADIDLTDNPGIFIPFFAGNFDGDDHIIDGLNINCFESGGTGLFGYTDGAVIEALGVINVNVTGSRNVGGLTGCNYASTINACHATGIVNGSYNVGCLVGNNTINTSISKSYATGSVTGYSNTGGLVGYNSMNSSISKSYAAINVTGSSRVGGLAGFNESNSTISESYANGIVTGSWCVGGLAGSSYDYSTISKSYANCEVTGDDYTGGLTGQNHYSQITNCVWNIETSGQTTGVGNDYEGTITNLLGSTSAEMQIMSTYTDIGWDFVG
jgi:hypothetical protein